MFFHLLPNPPPPWRWLVVVLLAWLAATRSPAETLTAPEPLSKVLPSSTLTPSQIQQKRTGYRETLTRLATEREKLRERYATARDAPARAAVLAEAREALIRTLLSDVFPAWDGTAWDFNGISEEPGNGAIACGYFVTTTLRDVGIKLPRIKLAQQPSQTIIRSLCQQGTIRVYSEKPLETIVEYLKQHGPGVYIVGLDCHTGFVVHDGTSMSFVHSSYFRPPRAVTAEPLDSDNPLKRSKYRMIGKLFGDELLLRWLKQQEVSMKKQGD